ncbi:class V chitinase-like [Daucus carota subsp. sativus]|uniref:class V chitinase-like n=1 Tax=Daucus carota subsp. sativus TaxID=79200 RepID=UPI0007EEF9BF|nr:PREDICTED: chitotriosidase-1-like [Daucus carota subsp. sativus]
MASKTPVYAFLICVVQFLHLSAAQNVKGGYWFPDSGIAASDIDSTLFTHLFCAFSDLDNVTYQVTISSANAAQFSQFTNTVQSKNPSVKTLLSIGGGSSNDADFAKMASTSASRKSFIDSSLQLARSNNFHGLDLDYEYPLTANDMVNLGTLLDEWRAAADAEAQASGKPRILLTAAVSVGPTVDGLRYPTQSISRSLDWINVMAYDFYGPWTPSMTNAHAALYDPSGRVSGSSGIESWIQAGVSANKLVFGLPFYGRSWQLVNPDNHGLMAPANGPPEGSGEGARGYNQILEFIANNNAPTIYNSTIVADYCYSGTTWIGYDDKQSISTKVSYAKQKGLLGYFAWQVASDANWALSQQAKQAWEE